MFSVKSASWKLADSTVNATVSHLRLAVVKSTFGLSIMDLNHKTMSYKNDLEIPIII